MRPTPPAIHFLTATDAAFATAAMSSRPFHRGRRSGFSGPGRSYSGGKDQFVTGDEHLQSVRDANSALRRDERGHFANQTQYHQVPPPPQYYQNPQFRHAPPPHQYQNPQFRHAPPPYQYQNPQFRHPPPPQFQNPQFRHRPPHFRPSPPNDHQRAFRQPQNQRPADYREWEPARTPPPPPHSERFKVLSYNILADYLAVDHRKKLYFHIPPYVMDWQRRKSSILFELGLWSADILCFQEVDRFLELAADLKPKGYKGIWKMRTGKPVDGCAIFWRTSRFNLLYEECIEFNKLGLRDNVAQICVLELINQNGSLSPSLTGSRKVVVCNIHVLFNPNRGEIKLGQVRVLLDKAQAVSKLWNNSPVIICGDFNCTPKSPLYNFITEQKLDLTGIDRDKVSGQASAVIPSPRFNGPNFSEKRAANGSAQAASTEGDKEVNIEQNSSLSDMQIPDTESKNSENQYTHTVLDMSDTTNVQCRRESDACAGKDTHVADHNKFFGEVDTVKEEPNPSYSKGSLLTDHINDEILDITLMTSSAFETVHTDPSGIGSTEHISDVQCRRESDACAGKDTQVADHNMIFGEVDTMKEEPNPSYSKGSLLTDHINDEILDITLMTSSAFETVHTDPSGIGSTEHISDATSTSNQESLSEKSNLHDHKGYKHMESYCSPTTLQEDNQASKMNIDLESTDILNVEISATKSSIQTSVSNPFENSHPGCKESPSSEVIANDQMSCSSTAYLDKESHQPTNINFPLDEKLEKLFLDEVDKVVVGSGNIGEDGMDFVKALQGVERNDVEDDLSPSPISKSINAENNFHFYNPSLWTAAEIETATGNAECTFLEHPLPLRSTYAEAMDCSGTRDPHGEPLVTSYHRLFLGTVDYIWRSEGLQTTRVLAPIPKHAMEWTPGFPTKKWGSDHIALVSELAFLQDGNDINKDI